jgi:aspartate racemase
MGPWVDPLILRKCLEDQATLGMRRDQDSIPILLGQYAMLVDDRSEYLQSLERGEARRNPAIGATRVGRALVASGARVLGVPCNTFHARPIFSRFEADLADLVAGENPVRIIHMICSTIDDIIGMRPRIRRVGILSSNGTYIDRIYSDPIAARALKAITLPYEARPFSSDEQETRKEAILEMRREPGQNDVHHAIFHPAWGIKSANESGARYPTARTILAASAKALVEKGAEVVILGCTEFPLAITQADIPEVTLYDPMDSLARGLVNAYRTLSSVGSPVAKLCAPG